MVRCDFEKGSQNQKYSFGSEGGDHKKEYSAYALDNVDNSG